MNEVYLIDDIKISIISKYYLQKININNYENNAIVRSVELMSLV